MATGYRRGKALLAERKAGDEPNADEQCQQRGITEPRLPKRNTQVGEIERGV